MKCVLLLVHGILLVSVFVLVLSLLARTQEELLVQVVEAVGYTDPQAAHDTFIAAFLQRVHYTCTWRRGLLTSWLCFCVFADMRLVW